MDVETRTDEAIYEDYAPELVRFASGLVGWNDAADVVAESFLALLDTEIWRTTNNHRVLLYRRVYLDAQSWMRSNGGRRLREHKAALPDRNAPDFSALDSDVAAAIRSLSAQQRAVVFLAYWDDLTVPEIAALLDVSEGTIRKQLARARARLRKELS
jgi:RNA polymerase sigma factor (sigma-70 family)